MITINDGNDVYWTELKMMKELICAALRDGDSRQPFAGCARRRRPIFQSIEAAVGVSAETAVDRSTETAVNLETQIKLAGNPAALRAGPRTTLYI